MQGLEGNFWPQGQTLIFSNKCLDKIIVKFTGRGMSQTIENNSGKR